MADSSSPSSSSSSPLLLAHRLSAAGRYAEAAVHFGLAADETDDPGAQRTLKALKSQHERKALDIDRARRRQQAQPQAGGPVGTSYGPSSSPPASPASAHRPRSRPGKTERRRERVDEPSPPFALALSQAAAVSSASAGTAVPGPAAQPMRGSTSLVRQAAERARTQRHLDRSRIDEGFAPGVKDSISGGNGGVWAGSGSWMPGGPGESSYLSHRERSDPFGRFWAVVEGMLGDYSSPVAFASAPIGSVLDGRSGRSAASTVPGSSSSGLRRSVTTPAKIEHQHPDGQTEERRDNQHDSFLLVSPQASSTASSFGSLDDFPTSNKTSEELQLENLSLRLSLDTLASHAHALERQLAEAASSSSATTTARSSPAPAVRSPPLPRELSQSTQPADPRARLGVSSSPTTPRAGRASTDAPVTTVSAAAASVVDLSRLRLEVEKVWRGEESRVLEMSRAVQAAHQQQQQQKAPGEANAAQPTTDAEKRIDELERQLAVLRDENAAQKETIARFKDRFERIKSSARKRREEERGREQDDAGPAMEGGLPAGPEEAAGSPKAVPSTG